MNIKIFGMRARLELVVLILMLGLYLGSTLLCNCMRYEGMSNLGSSGISRFPVDNSALEGSYMASNKSGGCAYDDILGKLKGNTGLDVPLSNDQLLIFGGSVSKPECCPATYSTSTGCICETDDQSRYLNMRGGNRTMASNF